MGVGLGYKVLCGVGFEYGSKALCGVGLGYGCGVGRKGAGVEKWCETLWKGAGVGLNGVVNGSWVTNGVGVVWGTVCSLILAAWIILCSSKSAMARWSVM